IVHPLENVFARSTVGDVRKSRVRRNGEGLVGSLIKTTKFRGMFTGLFSCLPGATIHRGLYFGLYDTLKVVVASDGHRPNFFATSALALGTTICADLVSLPFFALGYFIKISFSDHVVGRTGNLKTALIKFFRSRMFFPRSMTKRLLKTKCLNSWM
ncbi:hypothetical protein PMAYCL1PPCAC_20604, partial [Pristionchus mayeri]